MQRQGAMIDKDQLFAILKRRKKSELLEILDRAFDEMSPKTQRAAFLDLIQKSRPSKLDGPSLLEDVEDFHRESLEGTYYEPFDINSRNFTNIPEGTDEWCDRIADLLKQATQLTSQGDHDWAVKCFDVLLDLIEKMEYGEEIVFADEMGSWMIPIDEKNWIPAYMTSLAAILDPGAFAAKALPVIRRDSGHSFSGGAYTSARKAASKEQLRELDAELRARKVWTP
jgi:hypothetical protein